MTHDDDILTQIAVDEAWLAEQFPEPPGPDVASIKQRLRIELAERWLRQELATPSSAVLAERLKARVREELGRRRGGASVPAGQLTAWSLWARRGLAVAASIGFGLLLFAPLNPGPGDMSTANVGPPSELLIASLQHRPLAEDVALRAIDHDLRTLESTLNHPATMAADEDALLDDTGDELDSLLGELEAELGI